MAHGDIGFAWLSSDHIFCLRMPWGLWLLLRLRVSGVHGGDFNHKYPIFVANLSIFTNLYI